MAGGVTKQKNGLYQARFTFEGKRYSVYGKTKSEALRKRDKRLVTLENGLVLRGTVTLVQYYDKWQNDRRGTIKEATIYTEDGRFEYIKKELGSKKLNKISKHDIIQLQKTLSERLSSRTVNCTIGLLNTVLTSAYHDRLISWNPCGGVKGLKRVEEDATKTIHRALTDEELRLFFEYSTSYYHHFMKFLLKTGCRLGEAAALTPADIDEKDRMIHITKTVSRCGNKKYEIAAPKTKSSIRTIPITDDIENIVKDHLKMRMMLEGREIGEKDRIFTSTDGKGYITSSILCAIIRATIKKINEDVDENGKKKNPDVAYFSTHSFRATFATTCLDNGMKPQTLKSILGHNSLQMTLNLYCQVLDKAKRDEMATVGFVV